MKPELLRDLDRDTGWTLLVEGTEQSYVDVADAEHLEFEYMQHAAAVVDEVLERPAPVAAVHLGGGACTLPRWLAATRPGSTQVVFEASADVLAATAPLGAVPGTRIVQVDAAEGLAAVAPGSADLVVWDLYDGPRVVTARLSLELVTDMRRACSARGLVLLNVSDAQPFDIVRPTVAALQAVFADVGLLAQPTTLRGRRSGNCVLAAAMRPLRWEPIRRAAASAPVRARVVVGDALETFVAGAAPPTLAHPLPEPDERLGRGVL